MYFMKISFSILQTITDYVSFYISIFSMSAINKQNINNTIHREQKPNVLSLQYK